LGSLLVGCTLSRLKPAHELLQRWTPYEICGCITVHFDDFSEQPVTFLLKVILRWENEFIRDVQMVATTNGVCLAFYHHNRNHRLCEAHAATEACSGR